MDGWDDINVDLLRLLRGWLCDELNGQWTMIVDNAGDEATFFDLYDAKPHSGGGRFEPAGRAAVRLINRNRRTD
jgi:hypothetical protein